MRPGKFNIRYVEDRLTDNGGDRPWGSSEKWQAVKSSSLNDRDVEGVESKRTQRTRGLAVDRNPG